MLMKSLSGLFATVAAFCALALFPASAKADIDTIRGSNTTVWGSVGAALENYKEPLTPIPDSQHAWLPSLDAGIGYMGNLRNISNVYLAAEGSVSLGGDHYNGADYDSKTGKYDIPAQMNTHAIITEIDGKIGKGYAIGNCLMATPYLDLGFRTWDRNLGNGDSEDYRNFEALGGALLQFSPTSSLVISAYGAAGETFGAHMDTDNTNFSLGSMGIYKLGGKINYGLTPRFDIFTSLDFEHFRYANSPVEYDAVQNGYYIEPSSFTDNTAVRIGVAYHFK
jgi:hypothetical protein